MSQLLAERDDVRLATGWVIVESCGSGPLLIVVASATKVDATEPVARGLCEAACNAGKQTGYLYLGTGKRSTALGRTEYVELALSTAKPQRQALDASLPTWRSEFDVLIVEVPDFTNSSVGAHLARLANGVVVALSTDRRIAPEDRHLKVLLSQLGASILGVVRTANRPTETGKRESRGASVRSLFFPVRQQ